MEKELNSLGMVQMLGILQLGLLETVQLQMVDLWLEDTTQTGTTGTQAYKLMSYSYLTMFLFNQCANTLIHIFIWWRLSYDLAILNLEGGLGWSETCFAVSLYIADLYDHRL